MLAHPPEFKEEVLTYVKNHPMEGDVDIAKRFKLSPSTVWSWRTGSSKNTRLYPNKEEVIQYIKDNPDRTAVEISEMFDIPRGTIGAWISKLGERSQPTKKQKSSVITYKPEKIESEKPEVKKTAVVTKKNNKIVLIVSESTEDILNVLKGL